MDQSAEPAAATRTLRDALEAGEFVVTSEVVPPATGAAEDVLARARPLAACTHALNVTDAAGARAAVSSVAAAAVMARAGVEPIVQMTCRDRNRIALQADLLGVSVLGVRNVLVMTGDDPSVGDQPDAKPVFDLDTRALLRTARAMRDEAVMPSGRALQTATDFYIGATDAVTEPDADWSPGRIAAKVDDGAQFVQTQFCYDRALLERWIARLRDEGLAERAHFIVGLGPLRSAKSARWMRENLGPVSIPDNIVARLECAAEPEEEGVAICAELMRAYAELPGIAGVHLMAPANAMRIPETVERSGILGVRQARG